MESLLVERGGKKYRITLSIRNDTRLTDNWVNGVFVWTDGYMHTTKSGEEHFYLYHHNQWQDAIETTESVSREEMLKVLARSETYTTKAGEELLQTIPEL